MTAQTELERAECCHPAGIQKNISREHSGPIRTVAAALASLGAGIVPLIETARGLVLARRTIAKYREELKIPTSNQRKVLY